MEKKNIETIECVECIICGKIHKLSSDQFIRFQGNVYIGMNGGVLGGKQPDLFKDVKSSIVCREFSCLNKILEFGNDLISDAKEMSF
jgi:hypothetical protein